MPIFNPTIINEGDGGNVNPLDVALEVDEVLSSDFLSIHSKLDSLSVDVDLSSIESKLNTIESKIDAIDLGSVGDNNNPYNPELEQLKRGSDFWFESKVFDNTAEGTIIGSLTDIHGQSLTSYEGQATIRTIGGKKVVHSPLSQYFRKIGQQGDFNFLDLFFSFKMVSYQYPLSLGDYDKGYLVLLSNYPAGGYMDLYNGSDGQRNYASSSLWYADYSKSWIGCASYAANGGVRFSDGNNWLPTTSGSANAAYTNQRYTDSILIGRPPIEWGQPTEVYIQNVFVFRSRDKFRLNDADRKVILDYLKAEKPLL